MNNMASSFDSSRLFVVVYEVSRGNSSTILARYFII